MPRQPFVWEVQVRRELLEDELVQLRELPDSLWHDVIDAPLIKAVVGRDGRNYRLVVEARRDRSARDAIRVNVTLKQSGWRGASIRESFTITPPDNNFL